MLITLWNYLRGYVMIEVTGFSVERFVNLAVHRGVYIWDLQYTHDKVTMKVSIKAFKLLRGCAQKTKCTIKIAQKSGWPFLMFRYRKRKALLAGFLFFVASLYVLSMFVWMVDVQGVDRLDMQDILQAVQEDGLQTGTFIRRINTRDLEQTLRNRFPDIAWVSVHIRGTKATITLTETIPPQLIVDRNTPCDIVARTDGLIVSIATSAGTPMVRPRDVVRAGDILVSGEIIVKYEDLGIIITEYTHANAQVLAQLYYEMIFEVPYLNTIRQQTGQVKKRYALSILGRTFTLPNILLAPIGFENFNKITDHRQARLGENYPLPLLLTITIYEEFIPVEQLRTPDEAKALAETMLTRKVLQEIDVNADIMNKVMNITETPEGLLVHAVVTTIEDIGETRLLQRMDADTWNLRSES